MTVTVVLCILSTIGFCACVRAAMAFASVKLAPAAIVGSNFSINARKIARSYATGCFVLLAGFALVGAVHFYLELFQMNF